MDLKIDDLLEKVCFTYLLSTASRLQEGDLGCLILITALLQQKDNKHLLDLEYVQLNVPKVLGLLKKVFAKR